MKFLSKTNFDFMKYRKLSLNFAIMLMVASIISISLKGINLGLDFTGGINIEASFKKPIETEKLYKQLEDNGFSNVKIQHYGTDTGVLFSLPDKGVNHNDVLKELTLLLKKLNYNFDIVKQDFIGSEVGAELADTGTLAVITAILVTMLYIALRFEYRLAISAALALLHDSIIILGIFSLFQVEFDLATLAAILAVIGYSLNDTIIVFDRIRENFVRIRKSTVDNILNISINQTLSRTIITSLLTLFVVLALLIFGGKSLFSFSLALFLGIIFGTYSSIFIASTLALKFGLKYPESSDID